MKQLKYVLVLANAGSFSAAADELGISQPSLSQYIKKIEQQVGMPLFHRVNGNIRLTDAGQAYVDYGQKILALEHQMETRFSDISEHKHGSIIIGAAPYRSASMMPAIARRFKDVYPGLHLVVEEAVTSELLERAEKGAFDLCLTMLPVNESLFSYEEILEEELVIAVPASYPALACTKDNTRRYPVVEIAALNHGNFVMVTHSQMMQRALDTLCAEHQLTLSTAAVVKSLEAQINMVRAGVGMALVPTGIEQFCGDGEVRFYSIKQPLPKRHIVAMWRKDRPLSATTKELLCIMHEIYS